MPISDADPPECAVPGNLRRDAVDVEGSQESPEDVGLGLLARRCASVS